METLTVNNNDAGQTLFAFLKKVLPTTPLSVIYKLFRTKDIKVNNKRINQRNYILQENDVITIYGKDIIVVKNRLVQTKLITTTNLNVVYEDDNILIVDKPHGVQMHHPQSDVVSLDAMVRNFLIANGSYNPDVEQSFIVSHIHRLDKLTRGLVIYAKNKLTLNYFLNLINDKNKIEKLYVARVSKPIPFLEKNISGYITKDENAERMKFTKTPLNQTSKTAIMDLIAINKFWLEIRLLTGRKHQIRAALSALGLPIINDKKYNGCQNELFPAIPLYAKELRFHNLTSPFMNLNEKSFKINIEMFNKGDLTKCQRVKE